MLAKVATVNSVKRNTPVVAAQKSFDIEREKEANLNDKKAQISFWNGVYVATVIQKEKLTKKAKKTKFKRDTGPNQIEKIFAEHSKEVRFLIFSISRLTKQPFSLSAKSAFLMVRAL
jgi:superfamily I DNA and/or RNA helicase